ncbi:hypothetical protein DFH06DRAFT_1160807 [Mycena polygramma]|nr:hypothetical protein DFH06DRAFT_1160807 [Mycena polygramma]
MNLIQNGTGQVTPKLKYQLRNCANCSKPESCNTEGEKFKVCARCKIARYCSARCQKKDWPKHKRRCELQSEQTAIVEERDAIDAGLPVSLPLQAVYPLLNDWVSKYRALMCFSLLHAQGLWNSPPSEHPAYNTPQVFYVQLSSVPGISSRTKARAAFRVVNAEIVSISELRIAAKDRAHRMYDQDMQTIVQDFDRQSADQVSSGRALHPNYRGYMVVHSVYFHNGFSAMRFHKNWYFERDSRTDYTQQWRPPTDDWLDFLKETVAAGKGWDRDDIQF